MLADVDVLVYDIQDVGARFYTFISTMGEGMEAAADKGIPFIVLDRPEPARRQAAVEGPMTGHEISNRSSAPIRSRSATA